MRVRSAGQREQETRRTERLLVRHGWYNDAPVALNQSAEQPQEVAEPSEDGDYLALTAVLGRHAKCRRHRVDDVGRRAQADLGRVRDVDNEEPIGPLGRERKVLVDRRGRLCALGGGGGCCGKPSLRAEETGIVSLFRSADTLHP
jgi:hypothetical protein